MTTPRTLGTVDDQPTTLWTLRGPDHRWIECVTRFVPVGVQVEIVSDGWLIYSRIFPTGDEALLFAEKEHAAWTAPED